MKGLVKIVVTLAMVFIMAGSALALDIIVSTGHGRRHPRYHHRRNHYAPHYYARYDRPHYYRGYGERYYYYPYGSCRSETIIYYE
ncbi:MAG: hypothetical protein AB1454_11985 [Candidatus Auribacterota bacterium]|jgi:hypothetical protein